MHSFNANCSPNCCRLENMLPAVNRLLTSRLLQRAEARRKRDLDALRIQHTQELQVAQNAGGGAALAQRDMELRCALAEVAQLEAQVNGRISSSGTGLPTHTISPRTTHAYVHLRTVACSSHALRVPRALVAFAHRWLTCERPPV